MTHLDTAAQLFSDPNHRTGSVSQDLKGSAP
jgi:hypothetical protein